MTYILGNGPDFNQYVAAHKIPRPLSNRVRHVFNWQAALGLRPPPDNYQVVVLPSADLLALREMTNRGYDINRKITT